MDALKAIEGYFVQAQEHTVAQVILYSIPIINVVTRYIQNKHSIDPMLGDATKKSDYLVVRANERKFRADFALTSKIQVIVVIASIILGVIAPSTLAAGAYIGAGALGVLLSNHLYNMVFAHTKTPSFKDVIGY